MYTANILPSLQLYDRSVERLISLSYESKVGNWRSQTANTTIISKIVFLNVCQCFPTYVAENKYTDTVGYKPICYNRATQCNYTELFALSIVSSFINELLGDGSPSAHCNTLIDRPCCIGAHVQ